MANEILSNLATESVKDRHISATAAVQRAKLEQRVLAKDNIPLTNCRVWDAVQTNLPGTAASDDLGLIVGTLGTDLPCIETGDLKNAGATTRYARLQIPVPYDYEAGETVTLRLVAGMKTTIASTTATIDAEVYRSAEDGTVGSDICATSATTINSLTEANKDFTITPTTLVAGDILDVRIAIAVNDTGTGTAVIGRLVAIKLLSDRR